MVPAKRGIIEVEDDRRRECGEGCMMYLKARLYPPVDDLTMSALSAWVRPGYRVNLVDLA